MYLERDLALYLSTVSSGFSTDNTAKIQAISPIKISGRKEINELNRTFLNQNLNRNKIKTVEANQPIQFSFSSYFRYSDIENTSLNLLFKSLIGQEITFPISSLPGTFNLLPLNAYLVLDGMVIEVVNAVVQSLTVSYSRPGFVLCFWELVATDFKESSTIPTSYLDYTLADQKETKKLVKVYIDNIELQTKNITIGIDNRLESFNRNSVGHIDSPRTFRVTGSKISLDFSSYYRSKAVIELFESLNKSKELLNTKKDVKVYVEDDLLFHFTNVLFEVPSINIGYEILSSIRGTVSAN